MLGFIARKKFLVGVNYRVIGIALAVSGGLTLNQERAHCDALLLPEDALGHHVVRKPRGFVAVSKPTMVDAVVVPPKQSYGEWIHSTAQKLVELLRIMWRFCYLSSVLVPVAVTLPVAFTSSPEYQDWWWSLLRSSIRNCGPCLTKFAQWMATRPDIWGPGICERMKDLQSSRHAVSTLEDVERMMVQDFGANWKDQLVLYPKAAYLADDGRIDSGKDELDIIGSGCIAQVVKGQMKDDKETVVAVKVIHPGVKEAIAADISIMKFAAQILDSAPNLKSLSIPDAVDEFAIFMMNQLNLQQEAKNLETFRKNFRNSDEHKSPIYFPKPVRPFVSENVLVETFSDGVLCTELLDAEIGVRKEMSSVMLHCLFKMVFEDNFIHADLHPGNIICNIPANKHHGKSRFWSSDHHEAMRLSLIDAGLIAQLSDGDRRNFVDLFSAVVKNDGGRVGKLMVERSRTGTCLDVEGFANEMHKIVSEVHESGLNFRKISVSALLSRVMYACYKYQVKLESKFISVVLAIGVLEGLGRRLNPDVDLMLTASPYIARAAAQMLLPKKDKE